MLATVTQTSPLKVKVDGASTASNAVSVNGAVPASGARVLVELVGRVLYVQGTASSTDLTALRVASDADYATLRAMGGLHVPPTVSWSASNLSWTGRFIAIGQGTGAQAWLNGYCQWYLPTSGTVIPGVGGRASVTVTSSGIPLTSAWDCLWGVPPADTTANGSFAVSNYNTGSHTIPKTWVLLAKRDDDNGTLRLGDGQAVLAGTYPLQQDTPWAQVGVTAGAPAFQNGWSTYADPTYGGAFYRRVGGVVYLRGLISGGTASALAFVLPAGFRPAGSPPTLLFTGFNSTPTPHRFDVSNGGGVYPNISAPAWASIACSFPAEQ